MNDAELLLLLPEGLVVATALAVLLGGSFLPRGRQRLLTPVALAGLLGAAAAAAVIGAAAPTVLLDGTWASDGATAAVRVVAALSCAAVLLLGSGERRGSPRASETVALLLLATAGAMVLGGADDLTILVTGYLLVGIPLTGLVGLGRSALAAEAALKTYLQGALLGVLLLGGTAVLAGLGGGTGYGRLLAELPAQPRIGVAVGVVAVVVALAFEAGAVPAHFWVPDAAQASSRQVAAFLTTVPKIAAAVALLRLVETVQPAIDAALVVAVLAAASMLLGTFAAFRQEDVRRLLGWSAVGQAGFLLLPAAAAGGERAATPALLLAIAGYAAANLAAFAVVAALPGRTALRDWRGAAREHPVLAGALLVALLALVGTPPTSVFLGKLAVFGAAWAAGEGWLVVVGAVATVASLFYTLRWLGPAFQPVRGAVPPRDRADPVAAAVAVALAAVVLGFTALAPLLASLPPLAR